MLLTDKREIDRSSISSIFRVSGLVVHIYFPLNNGRSPAGTREPSRCAREEVEKRRGSVSYRGIGEFLTSAMESIGALEANGKKARGLFRSAYRLPCGLPLG